MTTLLNIRTYALPQSPEEAWTLNQNRANRIVAGMMWLRLSRRPIATAIDLSALELNGISQTEDAFVIGCMTPLRTLETYDGLNDMTGGAFRDALSHIVGVQFRNTATIGGSIYGRFGFSDPLTLLLALEAQVTLYRAGRMSLEDYSRMPYDRDLLLDIRVPLFSGKVAFQCVRNTQTDFSVLNCAMSRTSNRVLCAVGARPGRAILAPCLNGALADRPVALGKSVAEHIPTGGNMRATAEYRKHLAGVLAERCWAQIGGAE